MRTLEFCEEAEITLDINKNKELVLAIPRKSGVYLIVGDKRIKRLSGESDVIYIGRSGNLHKRIKYLLKELLPSDFASNWGRHTAREALKKILESTDIKTRIKYSVCSNYKELETKLLQKYCKDHIEGPPLNNQRK